MNSISDEILKLGRFFFDFRPKKWPIQKMVLYFRFFIDISLLFCASLNRREFLRPNVAIFGEISQFWENLWFKQRNLSAFGEITLGKFRNGQ